MLQPQAAKVVNGAHRGRGERRVDHDGQRRELPVDLLDRVDAWRAVGGRVNDQDVRGVLLDDSTQLVPSLSRDEGVLRAEYDFEVRKQLTGQNRYDVHVVPDRMSENRTFVSQNAGLRFIRRGQIARVCFPPGKHASIWRAEPCRAVLSSTPP